MLIPIPHMGKPTELVVGGGRSSVIFAATTNLIECVRSGTDYYDFVFYSS